MSYKLSIASHSLGHAAVHDLASKLDQAAKYGYEGIEVFFGDLELIAQRKLSGRRRSRELVPCSILLSTALQLKKLDNYCPTTIYILRRPSGLRATQTED
jgi:sugar phosphate isomerase/epimerase